MPLTLSEFAGTRPFLYHLTARQNLPGILATRQLQSAAQILRAAGRYDWLRQKRAEGMLVRDGARAVHLRDQAPLHRGNLDLQAGWSFEDLVQYLNVHVFFWPGTAEGPVRAGRAHYER